MDSSSGIGQETVTPQDEHGHRANPFLDLWEAASSSQPRSCGGTGLHLWSQNPAA